MKHAERAKYADCTPCAVFHRMQKEKRVAEEKKLDIHVRLDAAAKQRVDALLELSGATGLSEMTRRAYSLYELVLSCVMAGGTAVLRDKDGNETRIVIL